MEKNEQKIKNSLSFYIFIVVGRYPRPARRTQATCKLLFQRWPTGTAARGRPRELNAGVRQILWGVEKSQSNLASFRRALSLYLSLSLSLSLSLLSLFSRGNEVEMKERAQKVVGCREGLAQDERSCNYPSAPASSSKAQPAAPNYNFSVAPRRGSEPAIIFVTSPVLGTGGVGWGGVGSVCHDVKNIMQ